MATLMNLFGASKSVSMGEARKIVSEYMENTPAENISNADIHKFLDAFEICSAVWGLDPEQMQAYSWLLGLKCC